MGRFSEVVNEINTPEPPSGVLGANADQYSQADKLSRTTGLPVDAVQRNPKAAEEAYRWKNIDFANLEKSSPRTAAMLSTPGKGELFNDDVDNLSGLERGFREINRIGANLGNTAKAAYYRFGQSSAGLLQAGYEAGAEALDPLVGTVLPANPLRTGGEYFGDIARREKAAADYFRVSPEDAGFIERGVYSGIESFIQQTPGLVMSVFTASPAPMLAMAGGSEGGASYVEAREQGLGPWRSMNYASGQAAIEVMTEKLPAYQLLKDIGLGTGFMKTLANQMAAEIPQEQLATILQDMNTWASLNPERPFSEYLKERPSAAAQTLIATIVGTGGQVAVAQGTAAVMNRMGSYASNSKLRQRNVEAFEELVDELGAEAVYIDADAFRTYFQSQNIDPKAAAKELGAKDYDASLSTGEMLQIPASKYAARIAPTQHNAYFAKEIRLDPEMMNAREAEEYVKSLSTDIPTPEGGEQDVEDLILQEQTERLMGAGFDRQTAEDYASTVSAFFKTQAERYGVEAKELYDRYALEVTTEGMPEGDVLNQAKTEGYEGDNIGEAEEWLRAKAKGLDMSTEARMERARAMGFDTDIVWRHFTDADPFDAFDAQKRGQTTLGNASSPGLAISSLVGDFFNIGSDVLGDTQLGGRVVEVFLPSREEMYDAGGLGEFADELENHAVYDMGIDYEKLQTPDDLYYDYLPVAESYSEKLKNNGYKGVIFNDEEFGGTSVAVFNNTDIRSINAAFDPDFKDSPNLLAQSSLFPESNRLSNLDKNGSTWKAILNENPELKNAGDTVTIYRATIGDTIRPNDYVALNKTVADDHLANLAERGEAGRILTQEVPIDSLLIANDATEFVFSPSQLLEQKERGYLSIAANRQLKIGLLKDMDLSTFIHEVGHAYLEVFRDMVKDLDQRTPAELTQTQQQILSDAEILKKWFGVKSLDDIEVKHHEQFARGYELYAMEGNAPSVGLRRVFARFRAWLLAIYKTFKNLNVQLNDDVRSVMDRMLATDSEIEAARKEAYSDPLFTDAISAGMSEAEFKNYRKTIEEANLEAVEKLQTKILKEKFREQEKWWKEQLNNIAQDVETELNQRKDYIAADILRTGKSGEDDVPRLSRNDLKEIYSKEEMRALSRYVRAKGNVMTADEAADMFGFSSGDELVKTLINLPDKQLVIEQEARRRMIERHGNMMQDAAEFADAARHEVLSDKRKQVLEAELKALVKLQNKVKPFVRTEQKLAKAQIAEGAGVLRAIPPTRAFSDIAKGRIASMQVRDVRPSKYLVASRKAAKEAMASVVKQDYAAAAIHKQREILNLELYREAQRVKARNEKHVEYLRSFEKPKVRARIAKTGFLDPIDQILEQYSFKRQTLRAVDRRKSLLAFVESQEAQGIPVNIPAEVLEGIDQVPYLELTNEQLGGVYDAVKVLANLHKLKQRLLKIRDKRTFDEYADALAGSIIDNHKGKLKDAELESALPQKALGRLFKAYYAMHRKVPSYARVMDGHQDGGLAWEAFVRPINEAADREAVMREEAAIALQNIFKPYMTERVKNAANRLSFGFINKGLYRLEHYPYLKNNKFSGNLTKAGKLMVALNWGTESNRQRVMDGFGWSDANVQQLLNTLTQEDWQFVQGIWKQINSYWPEIKALAERVEGVAPAKVEGVQVTTPFGQIEGMYFPISYDAVNSQKGFFTDAKEAAQRAMQGATIKNTTKHGFRKDRVEVVKGQPISLDMGNIYSHINDVIHDITHYEALIDANRLLKDGRIKSAIDQTQGNEAFRQFQSYLNDVASGDHWNKTVVEKTALWLRTGVSIAAMGYNLSTAAIQFTGASQSIVRIGPQWFARGVKEWVQNPLQAVTDVQEKSSFMRLRSKTQLREINEIRNQVEGGAGQLTNSYFWMIAKMQMAVDMPTWLGQYQKSLANGESESKAIALADQAVKDSQGGGQVQDLAAIQRGNPLLKIFTAFYTYFNTTLNLTAESIGRADFTKPKDIGLMMVDMLMLYTVPAVLGILIRDALKGGDDEPIEERILREQLSYMLGTFVGLREAGSSVAGFYGYDGPAGARFFAEINKFSTQAQQGEMDRAFWKAFNNSAGILLHYPSGQVQKTVEGIIALQEGKTDNPKAILFGPEK